MYLETYLRNQLGVSSLEKELKILTYRKFQFSIFIQIWIVTCMFVFGILKGSKPLIYFFALLYFEFFFAAPLDQNMLNCKRNSRIE